MKHSMPDMKEGGVNVTPLFDITEPCLGGIPFFYWFQMAVIPLGILCTLAVHVLTRHADEEGDR